MRFGAIESDAAAARALVEVSQYDETGGEELVGWLADCPTGPNRWYAAFDGDRAVALCGLLPVIVEVNDCRHVGALCNNLAAVRPDDDKLLPELVEHALSDMKPGVAVAVTVEDLGPEWERHGTLEFMCGETTRAWKEIRQFDCRDFRYYPTFKRKPVYGHPRFMVVRGEAWMKWRYTKPGETYMQNVFPDSRHAIWSKGGRKRVMETNSWETITNLGGLVGVWQFRDSKVAKYLAGSGFKVTDEIGFMVHTDLNVDYDPDTFRFELCDVVDRC